MRNTSAQLWALTLILSTFCLTAGCASMQTILKGVGYKDPTITCRQVDVTNVSLDGVTLDFLFDVTNPNPAGFTIAELEYVLIVNDVEAARGREAKRIRIEPHASSEVRLPYTVKYQNLMSTALSFVKPDGLSYQLNIRFGLKTPIGILPINIEKKDKITF